MRKHIETRRFWSALLPLAMLGLTPLTLRGASPGTDEPIEVVETRGGKRYLGRVVGYDAETRSYLLSVDGLRVSLPEAEILSIRPADAGPAHGGGGDRRPAPAAGAAAPPGAADEARAQASAPAAPGAPTAVALGEAPLLAAIAFAHGSLPAPRIPAARKAVDEALDRIREGAAPAAAEPLRRALGAEPGCAAAAILLAAVHLEAGRDPEAAWPLLVSPSVEGSSLPAVHRLRARVAEALGWRQLAADLEGREIEGRFQGAEQQYRLYRTFERRDPRRALAAWNEFRRLDPRGELAGSEEALDLRLAAEAIEGGEATRAAGILARRLRESPLLFDEARPLLLRALSERARAARAAGRLEVALGHLRALAREEPERWAEIEEQRRDLEAEMVKGRVAALEPPEGGRGAGAAPEVLEAGKATGGVAGTAALDGPGAGGGREARAADTGRPAPPDSAAGPADLRHLGLVEGSEWTYLLGDSGREIQRLERVERLEDGRDVYRFACEYQLSQARIPVSKTGYFADGFFHIASGTRPAEGERLLRLPAAVGSAWSWRRGDILFEREYVALDARVTCRAGSFENCLKLKATSRFDGPGLKSRPVVQWFYFAPSVGLVKVESASALDGRELLEHRIGPPPRAAAERPSPAPGEERRSPGDDRGAGTGGGLGGSPPRR